MSETSLLSRAASAESTQDEAPPAAKESPQSSSPLDLVRVGCCICDDDDAEPVGVGDDFEYHTSPDSFVAMRCRGCGLVYLNPRPSMGELGRIYPPTYHAFDFSAKRFGLVYRVRRKLEARRAMAWCRHLGEEARVLDIGCGDGFHLRLLREFGRPAWRLEGAELIESAAQAARDAGLLIHFGKLEQLDLPQSAYDLVLLVQTIEHVEDPSGLLAAACSLLRPGGRIVIVTDNTRSLDFSIFRGRHWGGYHFPRHWNLFHREAMRRLAHKAGLEVVEIKTQLSPVNWVYSIRNLLVDWGAPHWLYERFSLRSPLSLAAFTLLDGVLSLFGRGALLRAILRRPEKD